MAGYIYTISCPDAEAEIAALEAWALTGAEPQGRIAYAPAAYDISRAAYVRFCIHIEAFGETLEELIADCLARCIAYQRFRLEFVRPPPKAPVPKTETIVRVANAITGRPDLSHPAVELAIVATSKAWHLGRIISVSRSPWLQGMQRPVHFSSALPQRLARALVNLVAAPGDTLIDPCCGIGTVLMEALHAGVVAVGCDINARLLQGVAQNLRHLGLPVRLFQGDARQLAGRFAAGVMDLPYGRNLPRDVASYENLIAPLWRATKRMALVAAQPLDNILQKIGCAIVRRASVPKGRLVRHIYLVAGRRLEEK